MGSPSKPAATRQRRNKASTRTTLVMVDPTTLPVPDLPTSRKWHSRTQEHWEAVWQSPMAPEFDMAADYRGMVMLAEMWDDFYQIADSALDLDKKARLRTNLAAQIMRNEQRFGLTPLDRRRLQWEIDRGEEADAKTRERRNKRAVAQAAKDADEDPRELLAG